MGTLIIKIKIEGVKSDNIDSLILGVAIGIAGTKVITQIGLGVDQTKITQDPTWQNILNRSIQVEVTSEGRIASLEQGGVGIIVGAEAPTITKNDNQHQAKTGGK